jgi:hypothetical protein
LYANACPISFYDPSGETILSDFLKQGFIRNLIQKVDPKYLSAMIFGTFAHYQIYLDVKKTYASAMYNVLVPGGGFADIVINPHLYEIKPEKGTQSAEDQLYRYVNASGGKYIPGEIALSGIIKDPLPLIGIQIEYFTESPGIIYYRPSISTTAIKLTVAAIILPMAIRQIQLVVSQIALTPLFGF